MRFRSTTLAWPWFTSASSMKSAIKFWLPQVQLGEPTFTKQSADHAQLCIYGRDTTSIGQAQAFDIDVFSRAKTIGVGLAEALEVQQPSDQNPSQPGKSRDQAIRETRKQEATAAEAAPFTRRLIQAGHDGPIIEHRFKGHEIVAFGLTAIRVIDPCLSVAERTAATHESPIVRFPVGSPRDVPMPSAKTSPQARQ